MIPTFIGTRSDKIDRTIVNAMQILLEANGLQTYVPQTFDGEADNPSVEWNEATGGLAWKDSTVRHLSRLSGRDGMIMLWSYNGYFRGDFGKDTYKTVAWPDPATGVRIDQDQLPLNVMASYLRRTQQWLRDKGITPWVMFDEPPHKADDGKGGGKYGWAPAVEARTLKVAQALRLAGIPVGVCHPNYQSLRFWQGKGLVCDWYILNEENEFSVYAPYLPQGAKVWLYNVRAASLPKLAERLAAYGAQGLVQWHAVPWVKDNDLPLLFDLSKMPPAPTEAAGVLLAQLAAYTKGGTLPAPTIEEQVAALRQEVAELKRELAALKAERRVYE